MGTLLPLLTAGAVPFNFPNRLPVPSIASRRRRHPAGNHGRDAIPELDLNAELMADLLNETGRAVQFGQLNVSTCNASTNTDPLPPTVPPNTPSQPTSAASRFEFPEETEDDRAEEEEQQQQLVRHKLSRRRRKRRRVPSFKKHRVVAKTRWQAADEADDEESDDNDVTATTPAIGDMNGLEDSDEEAKQELCLKLRIYSETQKSLRGQDADSSSSDFEDKREVTDWHKVGEELRFIADRFQNAIEGEARDSRPVDILSVVNQMLPVTIPQSVWSAIVSYAAWKFFKRFQ